MEDFKNRANKLIQEEKWQELLEFRKIINDAKGDKNES